jgi:FkbM family methyltransferase
MKALVKRFLNFFDRLRYLKRAMSLNDAIKIIFAQKSRTELSIFLKPVKRQVWLRTGTTDLQCLEKVFIDNEYESPFKVSPQLIVDAGANIGMATLFFAQQYPNARIVAIEPEPSNSEMLRRNCAGLPNVIILQGALWPVNGHLEIEDVKAKAWAFSVVEHRGPLGGAPVKAITVPDILENSHTGKVDILKLDIEGSELPLFTKAAEPWIDHVGMIVIELHDRDRPGCAQAFYSTLVARKFVQEIKGENIFVKLLQDKG